MKRVWLLSVPVLALLALFAVRSAPTLAGPACAATCGNAATDQLIASPNLLGPTYGAGGYVLGVIPGQYCSDKTGGQIYVPSGTQPDAGLTCPAVPAGSAGASSTTAPSGTAPAASGTPKASATAAAAASAPAGAGASATPKASATATSTTHP